MTESRTVLQTLGSIAVSAAAIVAAPVGLVLMTNIASPSDYFVAGILIIVLMVPSVIIGILSALMYRGALPAWKVATAVLLVLFGSTALGMMIGNQTFTLMLPCVSVISVLCAMNNLAPIVDAWPRRIWALAAFDVLVLSVSVSRREARNYSRNELRDVFQMASLPVGMQNMQCRTEAWLDVHQSCAFTLAPGEFKTLTVHTHLTPIPCEKPMYLPAESHGGGRAFPLANCYKRTDPEWQKQVGNDAYMMLLADAKHEHVVMDYVVD